MVMANLKAALRTPRIGLTGGIGSGKSTVANFFTQLGAAVIDADAISRGVTAPHGVAIASLTAEFGADFINAQGALHRDKMRNLVYADAMARKRLEAIVHPLVGRRLPANRTQPRALVAAAWCLIFRFWWNQATGGNCCTRCWLSIAPRNVRSNV